MWGKNRPESKDSGDADTTLISAGTEIQGDVNFTGVLLVEGKIRGNLNSEDGHLTLAESGFVQGDIRAPKMVINGSVHGCVYAMEHVELAAKAEITGNVYYNVIEMVKGSQVNGSLEHHPSGMPDIKPLLEIVSDDRTIDQG